MKINLKSREEVALLKEGADILGRVHGLIAKNIQPGTSTKSLDKLAEEFIRDHDALPSFKGYGGFPGTLCISTNDEIVHGVPGDRILKEGDIVGIDCGVCYRGFHSDSAFTYPVGKISADVQTFLDVTKDSLYIGIENARLGKRIGDIGYAVQQHVEQAGYSVVRQLTGHGIGKQLHEDPPVPNYGRQGSGVKLQAGMVLAIEPMVNRGRYNVFEDQQGVVKTLDRQPSAHFEHTVALWEEGPEILTTFEYIEKEINA